MKTRKTMKLACAALAAVMTMGVVVGCGGNSAKNYAENNTEYVIGASGPLTGGASVYGVAVRNSAAMAVEEIKRGGRT